MRIIFLISLLFIFSCGKNKGSGTVSSPSNFQSKDIGQSEKVTNKFFQAHIRHFLFQTDLMEEPLDLEFERAEKFKYYKLLGTFDFLNNQIRFSQNTAYQHQISSHVESFQLSSRKLINSFKSFTPYSGSEIRLRSVSLNIAASIDIDAETKKKVNGVDVLIWDHYKNEYFEIDSIPLSSFQKSSEYLHRYDFQIHKHVPLGFMNQLVKRKLTLLFRLEFKHEKEEIKFLKEVGNTVEIVKFANLLTFQKYLKDHKESLFAHKGKVIHNLNQANSNVRFYYLMKAQKKLIENDFTFLNFEEEEIALTDKIEPRGTKYIAYDYEGQLYKESWKTEKYKRVVHGHTKGPSIAVNVSCEMLFQKIDRSVLTPIEFNSLGPERVIWKDQNESLSFSGQNRLYFQFRNKEAMKLRTLKRDFQKEVDGRLHSRPGCGHYQNFDRIQFNDRFVYRRKEIVKNDMFKTQGVLKKFYIPWEMISWSEPVAKIGLFTE